MGTPFGSAFASLSLSLVFFFFSRPYTKRHGERTSRRSVGRESKGLLVYLNVFVASSFLCRQKARYASIVTQIIISYPIGRHRASKSSRVDGLRSNNETPPPPKKSGGLDRAEQETDSRRHDVLLFLRVVVVGCHNPREKTLVDDVVDIVVVQTSTR